ncbi:hypothetical protein [Actinomadura alba]|uniref:DUF3995 domain-containing protein n=1 Tax=Actinomadura alba TaxID=406431 RepID=A0ABR7LI21_9ACTN|nr:hypothetical protein [Actinomadura alba]MBC6464495.1 hypothetical protein [Actinomadura alba]
MSTLTEAPATSGRVRAAWTAAHAPAAEVPRWARIAAFAIPFTVLPAGIWRVAVVTFHAPIVVHGEPGAGRLPAWLPMELYVVLLSVGSELLAFAAVGLIATWGEVFPRWIPGLRGRRVPVLAAVVPAAAGAAVLTLMCTLAAVNAALGHTIQGEPLAANFPLNFDDWQGVLAVVAYAPLLLWGPLLGTLTIAYWRRRHRNAL